MRLCDFLSERSRGRNLARKINVSEVMISLWGNGKRPVPVRHCVAIERATGGAVTRKDLRPHDWQDIWPELSQSQSLNGQGRQDAGDGSLTDKPELSGKGES